MSTDKPVRVLSESDGDITDRIELAPQKTGDYRTVKHCICGAIHDQRKVYISAFGPLHMPCCWRRVWFEEEK